MRKFAFAIGAAALMLLAGVLTAEAMTGSSTLGLRATAKNFSPIDDGCLPRVRAHLRAGTDLDLPSPPRLLVRPLLALIQAIAHTTANECEAATITIEAGLVSSAYPPSRQLAGLRHPDSYRILCSWIVPEQIGFV